jgi:reactive intermediate/imine deaminase
MGMAAQKQMVDPGWGWNEEWGYSQGMRVGDVLYLAGQMPVDPQTVAIVGEGDIRAQVRQVFENIKTVLAVAGSTLDDIVEMVIYLTDMANLEPFGEIAHGYITKPFPAATALGVTALVLPGQKVEVKVVALAH